jgi:hypothetical protein
MDKSSAVVTVRAGRGFVMEDQQGPPRHYSGTLSAILPALSSGVLYRRARRRLRDRSAPRLQENIGAVIVRNVEYRIMQNRPGPGWYWELIESREVLARGLADTHRQAVSQAAEVARAVRDEQLQQSA